MTGDHRIVAPPSGTLPVFSLRKTWWDDGRGIEMVQIHYAYTPLGGQPEWEDAEQVVMQPDPEAAGLRSAVLEVPRFVAGSPSYALHHFFFTVRGAQRSASPIFTEEVVAREISYRDDSGAYTSVGLMWHAAEPDAGGRTVPNYTAAAMDGLPFVTEGADAPPEPAAVYEFVRAQPLPHVFRALIWGIAGTQVRYAVHLLRAGSPDPADDDEAWADDDGRGWTVRM